ncbi:MAG TPA: UDP-2,3-diacylglucosamine diphosphatase [Isosphaeraceae bacterium]|nr:UDP-2,3-diacylglucosamine diphosphatase [Isosphaeraceae bacterium]
MAAYFASDVHLRLDHPERGRRLARFVDRLDADDTLTIVGDLCDFWLATRQRDAGATSCAGLRALAAFHDRGGAITVLPGNHDIWSGSYYEQTFGARFLQEPLVVEASGLRVHLVHGHRLGARKIWKKGMESHTFFEAFGAIPPPLANMLDILLERSNERGLAESNRRHLAAYRRYAASIRGQADLLVLGHIHAPLDDPGTDPRMIILGGWHRRSSYLKIDDASGATLIVEHDPPSGPAGEPVESRRAAAGLDTGPDRPVS